MSQRIRTVAVVGCGVIGSSWASLFLSRGLKVIIFDPAAGAQETFKKYLKDAWPSLQASGALKNADAGNFEFVDDVRPSLPQVDFVQENGPERPEFKRRLMETLDQYTRTGVVIASSSSGLPSSGFIQQCRRDPGRILIGHPFNPPHLVPLVEVVPHPGTNATAVTDAIDFYKSLGKHPILLRREVPGFVANRLQAVLNNEAYSLVSRGIVSAEDLDAAVTSGPGLRWALTGPFVTNAFGGGGGAEGFAQRIERLGSSIRGWEEDILEHRFDWSEESMAALKEGASASLKVVDWEGLTEERDRLLLELLAAKSKDSSDKYGA
ncbi:hypothetical protein GE09DRAFT_1044988 [Coniochaeta sp. 2T2.1]|nr:hypothetical protein GE09DRAFT_1044988 [Coniochaeta sp. 2T2.1]